jgi:hypothetical protein
MNPTLLRATRLAKQQLPNERRSIPAHSSARGSDVILTRRQFVGSTAGSLAAAAGLGSLLAACGRADDGFLTSPISPQLSLAKASAQAAPVPIPGGTPALGGAFHVWAPAPPAAGLDSIDAEPATITNFNGFVGLAYISGMVTRRSRSTGETVDLPFLGSDMRFMTGVYRGDDGRVRRGTFGFI